MTPCGKNNPLHSDMHMRLKQDTVLFYAKITQVCTQGTNQQINSQKRSQVFAAQILTEPIFSVAQL